jgi:transposase
LHQLEKQQHKVKLIDRVRFIGYLKEGTARTQAQAGKLIGLQERQSQNLWQLYKQKGLQGMLTNPYRGTTGKLSYSQVSKLRAYLKTDQAATLEKVQNWLQTSFNVKYTIGGISLLFKRLKIKLKTGRAANIRQNPDEKQLFKKTSPN